MEEKTTVNVSIEEITFMKHMIGLDKIKPFEKEYVPYRNYAGYSKKEKNHESLVERGLAKVICREMFHEYIYSLTPQGFIFLEKLLNIKIHH